ncbi:MAG: bifunctional phosphoglucose/phosphomannose isomerase [candidate division WOR-3 bacterium]
MVKRTYQIINSLPEQIEEEIFLVERSLKGRWARLKNFRPENIIISGMGGSGIGGEILSDLGRKYSKIPIITVKDYNIPKLTGKKTLFFAVSYSGNTEETLATYYQARKKGSLICVVTSGGELKVMAQKNGDILIPLPPGIQPRQALGFLLTPLLVIIGEKKFLPFSILAVKKAAEKLKSFRPECEKRAKILAQTFYQKIPYILAGSPLYAAVAYRWKCQLNENSKILAFANTLPEQNHNEIEGIGRPKIIKKLLAIALLLDPSASPKNNRRVEILPKILSGQYASFQKIEPWGENDLERIFFSVLLGDLVSYYLGVYYKKDIEKIERIEKLKALLKEIKDEK